jgi:hypothetical protein
MSRIEQIAVDSLSGVDAFVNDLFAQEFFTIGFGIVLWFALQWSMDRNKWSSFRAWLKDQYDEILVVTLVGFALISFDDVAVRQLERSFGTEFEFGKIVYLLSGPLTLGIMKLIQKLRK